MKNKISAIETENYTKSCEKKVWVRPSLRELTIAETNGTPGKPQGDGNAPFYVVVNPSGPKGGDLPG